MQITPTKLLSALCIYVGAAMNPSYSIYGRDTKLSCGGGEIHDSEREGGGKYKSHNLYTPLQSIISVLHLQNHLEHLAVLMVPKGSLGIWECTEKSMADRLRLVSHPWIYTQFLTGLINWNTKGRELKSEISDWVIVIIFGTKTN